LNAHTEAEFKKALETANPGDIIVLDAGVTYQGNFTLPVKTNPNNKWIYIVSSGLAKLPAPGTRVAPADAANMPKITSSYVTSTIIFPPGANHYRLVGLEVTTASTQGGSSSQNPYTTRLVDLTSVPGKPLVDSITVDRCYIHGSPTQDVRQGVMANGSNVAVIDSYISDIHQSTNDSQAVEAYYSPGPIKIVNNFLESTGENVMFGGAGGYSNPWVPSDIEIRGNYFFKPLAWAKSGVGGTIPPNNQWAVKNLLEFKSARRVLVDSNLFENVWTSAQMGFALNIKVSTTQSGSVAVTDDVTITNNVFKNVSSGFDLSYGDPVCSTTPGCTNPGEVKRVVFNNNLFLLGDTTQTGYTGGYGWGGIIFAGTTDFVFQHNTVVQPPNLGYCKASIYFETHGKGPPTPAVSRTHNVWILDNVLCRQINGGGLGFIGQFPYTLANYMGDPAPAAARFAGNVMFLSPSDKEYSLPPHNYVTSSRPKDADGGNYYLKYPAKMATTDGQVAGIDKSRLATAFAAESGVKPSSPSEAGTTATDKRR